MREAPQEFQAELTRIGGVNRYGDPIFKLVWSQEPRTLVGGRFADGYVGYRQMPAVPGEPCWALMIYESAAVIGSREAWERDYRDEETGLYDCGPFPRYGRYRLLRRLMHTELSRSVVMEMGFDGAILRERPVVKPEVIYHKMQPCGLILDLMLPMLMAWRRLSEEMKLAAVLEAEKEKQQEVLRQVKDARDSVKVKRSWQLVQKRAEQIEKGMDEAMRRAAQWGLGMAIGA